MNPARPAPGALIAYVRDLPDPGARAFEFAAGEQRFSLILVRKGGDIRAYENECPHAGSPLDRFDGMVLMQDARYLICSAHMASFAWDSGACAGGPCNGDGLTPIAIEVRDGAVFILRPARD